MISKSYHLEDSGRKTIFPTDRKVKEISFLGPKQVQKRMSYLQYKVQNANFLEENKEDYLQEYYQLQSLLLGNKHFIKHETDSQDFKIYSLEDGLPGGMINEQIQPSHENTGSGLPTASSCTKISEVFSMPLSEQFANNLQSLQKIAIPTLKNPKPFIKKIVNQDALCKAQENAEGQFPKEKAGTIEQLVYYLQHGMNASFKTLGKDLVFLLGTTGAGKSTMIHFLAGVKIQDVSEKKAGKGHVSKPILKFSQILEGFKVSSKGRSQTLFINVYEIEDLPLADTAGLTDTKGQNFDLANTVSLEKTLHNANSVRMIILINQATIFGPRRAALLIELITEVTGYMKSEDIESFIPTLTVIVNHVDKPSSDYFNLLKGYLEEEKVQPIAKDPAVRPKVLKFMEAMVAGAQFEAKKDDINDLKDQINDISEQLLKCQTKVNQADISKLQKRIISQQEQIKQFNKKIERIKLDEQVTESSRKRKIQLWQEQISDIKKMIKRITSQIADKAEELKEIFKQIEVKQKLLERKKKQLKLSLDSFKQQIIKAKKERPFFNEFLYYSGAKICNPDQRKYLINSLKACPRVENTKEKFQMSIQNSLKVNTQNMVNKIVLSLHDLLKGFQYKVSEKRLDDIVYLSQFINTEMINRCQENCCKIIKDSIEKNCKNFKKILDDSISERGQLANQGVENLIQCIRNMDETLTLIKKIPNLSISQNSQEGLYNYTVKKFQWIVNYVLVALGNVSQDSMFKAGYAIEKLQKLYLAFGNQLPKIHQLYQKFTKELFQIFDARVNITKQCIKKGDYYSLTEHLTFIKQFKIAINGRFEFDSQKIYKILIGQVLNSLDQRCTNGFEKLTKSLTCATVKNLQEEFMAVTALAKQNQLMRHIGFDNYEKFISQSSTLIQNHSLKLIAQIKKLIAKNSFQQLKDPMTMLCDIRKIDDSIAAKTSQEYARFISRLQTDLTGRSNEVIKEVMRKVKLGNATEEEINNLKTILNKLSKMTWLQSVLGSEGIKEMLGNTMDQLKAQATSISQGIKNTFFSELAKCQDQEISTSDDSFSDRDSISSIGRSSRVQTSKFSILNSSIRFCKKISEISQPLKQHFTKVKEQIIGLVDSECSKSQSITNDNEKQLNLHKIQLERNLIRLNAIKDIQLDISYKIQETLGKSYLKLTNYYEKCFESIKKSDFSEDEIIKKCVTTCSKLFDSLSICDHLLRKRNIKNEEYKENLLKILKDKFYEFFQLIEENMKNHKFNDVRNSLQHLKKYRTSDVNNFLRNQLKEKYEQLFSDYNKQINDIPSNIDGYFKSGQFSQLTIVFEQYKKNGNERGCRNIQNKIINTIEMESQTILDDISTVNSCQKATFKAINASLRRFNQYKNISEIVPTLNYNEKRQQITSNIKAAYKTMIEEAETSIRKLNFKDIKSKIDRIIDFNDILLKSIADADYKVQTVNIRSKFEEFIAKILDQDLKLQWRAYFSYIDKLKIIDDQYDGKQHRFEYVKKLKAHLNKICAELKDSINIAKNKELEECQLKLKNLKKQTFEYLSGNHQFNGFLDQYQEIERQIQEFNDLQSNDSKYSSDYLKRIKTSNREGYIKLLKQLKSQYQMMATKIQDANKSKNYSVLSSASVELQKFKDLKDHICFPKGKSPSEYQASIKAQINKRCSIQKDLIYLQLEYNNVENSAQFSNFKEYFQILLNVQLDEQKDAKIIEDAKIIHSKIIECIEKMIPKANVKSTVSEHNYRLQTLMKYQNFMAILKKYVELISSSNKVQSFVFYDFSSFATKIRSIQSASQYESKLCSAIRGLPLAVKEYFDADQFKKISQTLIDVKSTKTTESAKTFVDLSDLVRQLIESLGTEVVNKVEERMFEGVNDKINKIRKAQEQFKNIKGLMPPKSVLQKVITHIDNKIRKQLVEVAKKKCGGKKASEAVKDIIEIKQWVNQLPFLYKIAHTHLEQIFVEAQKYRVVGEIKRELEKENEDDKIAAICNQVLHAHRQKLSIPRLMPKMTIKIEDCIAQFSGQKKDSIDKEQLLSAYKIYLDQFESLREKFISGSSRAYIAQNLVTIKDKALETLQKIGSQVKLDKESKKNIPILLARLFIYMSIMKSADSFYNALDSEETSKYASEFLLQPHPIQVLSILRFIGCDSKTGIIEKITGGLICLGKLQNHLMQIKTGEGKSIILGAMSLLLSLMGNQVYCVCYSTYLSERDYQSFKDMFEAFGVIDRVKYGTFSQISEMIINEKGNVRNLVSNLFSTDKKSDQFCKKSKCKGSRVLLVDEVDTFFSKDFYGNTYNPCALLQNTNILEIIKFIWAHRNNNFSQIETPMKDTPHYKNLCNQYKDCMSKIDGQLKIMIRDVKNFKSRDYIVKNGRIGYKELDGVSFNSVYGYETMFLYMHEHSLGNITEETLRENLGITLSCGSFSYAEMIDGFDKIFGVSGTLENLNVFEQNILKRYQITSKTFAPSVYGASGRVEKAILIEEGQGRYYQTIASTILEGLKKKGAILVFFKNEAKLQKFKNSAYTEHFRKNMNVVTEKTYDRDFLIKKATSSELATLLTATFGRGTDFLVFNPIVKQRGLDVIQTFLSEQLSQEIQVKGRTARQGAKGTYQLILQLGELTKKYKVTKEMISKATQNPADSVAKLLQRQREAFCNAFNSERDKNLEESKKAHINSIAKRNAIIEKTIVRDDQFFFATTSGSSGKAKICITIDSTGSMGGTIAAVKDKVMKMIQKLAREYPNQFEIQIMFYYGYNTYDSTRNSASWSGTNKLHVSPWSADVKVLNDFLRSAGASGGSSHEAIEVALHHLVKCNEEVGMNKAILIGDAGLEGRLDSSLVYHVHPENASRYAPGEAAKPMTLVLSKLLDELKSRGVQVDTYAIGNDQQIQVTGKQISDATKGTMTPFNPDKDDLGAKIELVITECIKMKR